MTQVKFDRTNETEAILVFHDGLFFTPQVMRFEDVAAAKAYAKVTFKIPLKAWEYYDNDDNPFQCQSVDPIELDYWMYDIDETSRLSIHTAQRVCEF
jgi:hypothetical protein